MYVYERELERRTYNWRIRERVKKRKRRERKRRDEKRDVVNYSSKIIIFVLVAFQPSPRPRLIMPPRIRLLVPPLALFSSLLYTIEGK